MNKYYVMLPILFYSNGAGELSELGIDIDENGEDIKEVYMPFFNIDAVEPNLDADTERTKCLIHSSGKTFSCTIRVNNVLDMICR